MSETVKPYDRPEWECPILAQFLGKYPVMAVNEKGEEWNACTEHPLSLVGACVLIASTIFGEQDRNKKVKCPTCREDISLFLVHNYIKDSTMTITEELVEEEHMSATYATHENGKGLLVPQDTAVKIGHEYEESKILDINTKPYYRITVDTVYEVSVPYEDDLPRVMQEKVRKTYDSDHSFTLKPTKTITYQETLAKWKKGKHIPNNCEEFSRIKTGSTSHSAHITLAADNGWENQEYAPLVRELMKEFKGKDRDKGQLQLYISTARDVRDLVRRRLDLPLGENSNISHDADKQELDSNALISRDNSGWSFTWLGAYNIVFVTVAALFLTVYAFSKGFFNNLIGHWTGTHPNVRQHTMVRLDKNDPSPSPYHPRLTLNHGVTSFYS